MKLSVIVIVLLAVASFTSMAEARKVGKRNGNGIQGTIQSISGNEITIQLDGRQKGKNADASSTTSSSSSSTTSSKKKSKAAQTMTITVGSTTTVLVDGNTGVKLDASVVGKHITVTGSKDTTGKYNVSQIIITSKSTKAGPSN